MLTAALATSKAHADYPPPTPGQPGGHYGVSAQVGPGAYLDGVTAGGNFTSLKGATQSGTLAISCPYVGATWRISGGGIFSTAATPGNITPQITFGTGSVQKTIGNILATALDAGWSGEATIVCETIGNSSTGKMRVHKAVVGYATGVLAEGTARLTSGGTDGATVVTMDNTGTMAVDIKVQMANQSASNKFRLDGLTIERVY